MSFFYSKPEIESGFFLNETSIFYRKMKNQILKKGSHHKMANKVF
jgi:hypothetical protein